MSSFNILSLAARFLDRSVKLGLGVALSTLVDIPFVMKHALAEGTIGRNDKKLLFIFLRGGIDGLNTVLPIQDSAYNATNRPDIYIPRDPGTDYSGSGPCHFPESAAASRPDLCLSKCHPPRQRVRRPASLAQVPGAGLQRGRPGLASPGGLSQAVPIPL